MIFLNALKNLGRVYEKTDEDKVAGIAKKIIFQILHFLFGLLLSSVNTSGSFSPLGVAFCASAGQKYLISACFGSAAGYILTQDSTSALKYIAAILCSAVLISLAEHFEKIKKFRLLPSCTAFLMLFLTSMAVLFAGEVKFNSFAVYVGEASAGFIAAYLFGSSYDSIKLFEKNKSFAQRDIVIIILSLACLLVSVDGITVSGVSPARIIMLYVVLLSGYLVREGGAAFTGAGTGIIFALSGEGPAIFGLYSAAGLAAALFSFLSRYWYAFSFFITYVMGYALLQMGTDKAHLIIEAAVSTLVFCALPEKMYEALKRYLIYNTEPVWTSSGRQAVLSRLKSASAAVEDVSFCMNAASDMLKENFGTQTVGFYSRVRDEVCRGCRLNSICWNKNFSDCKKAFDEMSETLNSNKKLCEENMPQYISGCCIKQKQLSDSFNSNYLGFAYSRYAGDKIEKIRQLTVEQFGSVGALLSEISVEFADGIYFDEGISEKIDEALINEYSVKAESVSCTRDKSGHLKIDILLNEKPKKLNEQEFHTLMEGLCLTKLSRPIVSKNEKSITVTLCEQTLYRVEASASRTSAYGDSLCGDSYEGFYDGKGNYTVVLSDGMGTGLRAAVDSSLTAVMTARLLKSGFSVEAAVRLVNSAMQLKSTDESLATLDILQINLYTGNATFFKAGASPSLVKSRGKIRTVSMPSMPIGILKQTDYAEACVRLKAGDLVLVASDGAFEYSENEISSSFALSLDESVQEISARVLARAKESRKGVPNDDITVIAIKIIENI